MEIIEFDYDRDIFFNEEDLLFEGIKFFFEGEDENIYSIVEFIAEFYGVSGQKGAENTQKVLSNGLKDFPEDLERDIIEEIEYWTEEKFLDIEQLLKNGYYGEVMDYLYSSVEYSRLEEWIKDSLLPSNNFRHGMVGYSQWANYIAYENTNRNYIRSIWDGTDFYVISVLDKNGEIKDSVGWYYASDVNELLDYVGEVIGDKEFKVVENDISLDMNVSKVKKVYEVDAIFKDIK